jgi:UDP-N-acetylmuramoyl-L-alanyl-D-glutamate--2,6-diaminopimelate ligase
VEVVPTPGTDYTVLIDYAHTPDGLENVLSSVRGFCTGRMLSAAECEVLTTAVAGEGGLTAKNLALRSDGIDFDALLNGRQVPVSLGIPGKFTVYNALTVLGLAVSLGISLEDADAALADAPGVKGRVEVVPTPGTDYTVLIDYAHTPDGLENVLSSVRGFCTGRMIAVFGCGGDRDRTKRPIMGKIGA